MNLVNHTLKALLLVAAALAALWAVSTVGSFEPTGAASEACPNSTLKFCVFFVV